MFNWLKRQIQEVRTHKFFEVEGPATKGLLTAVQARGGCLPPSYVEFVLTFGNVRLYRVLSYYVVGVQAPPEEERTTQGELVFRMGHRDDRGAYFKHRLLKNGEESPVFEAGYRGARSSAVKPRFCASSVAVTHW